MSKLAKLAGTMPFAHLLGVRAAKAKENEEDDKANKAESDDDEDEAKKAESDENDDMDDKEKKDSKKSNKAESDDDETDEDSESEKDKKASRLAERARCAAIVAHGINTGSVRQACAYAFDTNMSANTAIATLDATASDRKGGSSLADRMATVTTKAVKPEADSQVSDSPKAEADALVGRILAAGKKARGEA